jgi:hypothetical protein
MSEFVLEGCRLHLSSNLCHLIREYLTYVSPEMKEAIWSIDTDPNRRIALYPFYTFYGHPHRELASETTWPVNLVDDVGSMSYGDYPRKVIRMYSSLYEQLIAEETAQYDGYNGPYWRHKYGPSCACMSSPENVAFIRDPTVRVVHYCHRYDK